MRSRHLTQILITKQHNPCNLRSLEYSWNTSRLPKNRLILHKLVTFDEIQGRMR